MQHLSLETMTNLLAEQLCSEQDSLRCLLVHQLAHGKPVAQTRLSAMLQISQQELAQRLAALPDIEFDEYGNIVGQAMTLVPTSHRVQIRGTSLYAWCAFDTVEYPPVLNAEAQVHSTCPTTGQTITFVVTPEGEVRELTPAASVMSLMLPRQRSDSARAIFCVQSLFFSSEQAASQSLSTHPQVVLLSVAEAASLGRLVAQQRFSQMPTWGDSASKDGR